MRLHKALAVQIINVLVLFSSASWSAATTVDFEKLQHGQDILDLYTGIYVTGVNLSGRVYNEGTFDTLNFGNSSSKFAYTGNIGDTGTSIDFVHPTLKYYHGATAVSVLVGDGDPISETTEVTFYNLWNQPILTTVVTTLVEGIRISGPVEPIGAMRIRVVSGSESGAAFDDLEFTLLSSDILLGDSDDDRDVDGADFLNWQRWAGFGIPSAADWNGDMKVDQHDLEIWRRAWRTAESGQVTGVPEQSTGVLAIVFALVGCSMFSTEIKGRQPRTSSTCLRSRVTVPTLTPNV
ncbi:hypothetical protein [Lacipirellula limnantheis]|uniref:Uncharacterized protein n=1 Tax=Lacipirellula limnantheis TaxID=2528024 RepID=A0A517U6U8_9BACT|nr:hypothetical protein [Lacipirellula limnantheis]QDT76356.1 hypothetical protein I41_56060 [Lacipirellula limnantheis]